ncbi:putative Phosphatidylinositol N-acetylglucosaminyltransferase [Clostridiaceae bacterium BL-3]|nr:putative Phosphatidylinositol N-acetylglucosaminyltransferase [Clostridiaceae bacterium BL-3]
MKKVPNLKRYIYIDILFLFILILIKAYIYFFEADFQHMNIRNIDAIKTKTENKQSISFEVLGNVNNSITIFENRIIKKINSDFPDFVILNGNSVIDGAEDKYRMLYKSLKKINSSVIVGIGEKEIKDNGLSRYYKHFGDTNFSFKLSNSYFIFLDTTNESEESWQKQWIISELENSQYSKYKFIFMNRPPYKLQDKSILASNDKFILSEEFRTFLTQAFSKYNVTAVFASNIEGLDERKINGVSYFTSGGAGGIITDENNFYHYIKVNVSPKGVSYNVIKQENISNLGVHNIAESIWLYIHSLFYINFINILIFLSIVILISMIIYTKVFVGKDYYKKYDEITQTQDINKALKIAMFTNNFLPFIGGVPISIDRLSKGLRYLGHDVYVFAPEYPDYTDSENYVIRNKLLIPYKTLGFQFPVINIFSSDIEKIFNEHDFDIVHVHHPFWMGKKGLKLARKNNIPVILTYHTRLEQYAHYIPVFSILFKNVISHHMIKNFSQKCDVIIAPTMSAKEYLRNIGVSRHIEILSTGVDFENYPEPENSSVKNIEKVYRGERKILLCSVSRLAKEKNLYFLLDGIEYIKKNLDISFKCIIIGDGPEKENIIEAINDRHLKDVVELIGSKKQNEIYSFYTASDIFIFASQSETQGMVILEAMAGRCPVVSVRSSGIEDIIQNGFNGFKTRADVKEWADKIIYLMKDDELRHRISENSFDFAKQNSVKGMSKKASDIYHKAIINKRKL